jgi:transcriptional regulator with XRE-family HTH domain
MFFKSLLKIIQILLINVYNGCMNKFQSWLIQELQKRNLYQKEFAAIAGVSEGMVSRYLTGTIPGPVTIIRIAKEWDIPQKELLDIAGYDENLKPIKPSSEPKTEEQEEKDLDAEIQDLCKHFQGVFLDKRGDLSIESKKVVIDVLKYVIQKEGGKTRKGE